MLRLKVREIAEQKGYNQSTLSRASDVPINTIRRIWRNPYYEVRLATLNRIAVVLGVPTTDLFRMCQPTNTLFAEIAPHLGVYACRAVYL